ncbi:MAG: hypothetical protein HY275_14270 [Gemmatimonadetes bacterium]|nr:hypothetical protein [Gemmatimonadota bacterium]
MSRKRRISTTMIGLAIAGAACSGVATGGRSAIEGETVDTTTAAFLRVATDGGNTATTTEWTVDSASSAIAWVVRRKDLPAGSPPVAQGMTLITTNVVKQLFAATQSREFRALHAHYPSQVPDMARGTIEVQVNGRRRTIDGAYPDPALTLDRQVQALAPAR